MSVVIPFAGDTDEARRMMAAFAQLRLGADDEVVVADNTVAQVWDELALPAGWRVTPAIGEGSPARARNAGALVARGEWLLFIDSDCVPHADVIDAHLATPRDARCGIVAGAVASHACTTLAQEYADSRRVLDQTISLADPAGPWALTANLLVRRSVWRALGGFLDGVRNGEDPDFCWRARQAGWTLEYEPAAVVEHIHRPDVRGLLRQRAMATASAGWLYRRHFDRPPHLPVRMATLGRACVAVPVFLLRGQVRRARLQVIDGLMVLAEVWGRGRSNRARRLPVAGPGASRRPVQIWCDEFPVLSETFVVSEARALIALGHPVEVVAGRRPDTPALGVHDIPVRYLEDDTRRERMLAAVRLAIRRPVAAARDARARRRWMAEEEVPPLRSLAPAALALDASPNALPHAHFAAGAALSALRVARLVRRPWTLTAHAYDIYLMPRNLEEKLRAASVVTSGCDYTVADLRRIAGLGHDNHVHRIIMGVDPDRFRRDREPDGSRTVIAIGRLVEKKGFVHLIRAAAEPQLREVLDGLTIIGDGPLRDDLQAEIDRLGVGDLVTLAGRREPDEIRAMLQDAAVLAMPCVVAANGDRDSMPVVVKEALATEVPVVVTDEVGLPELARPEFARVVPPGEHAPLAAALAELLALTPEQRAEMGRAGRAFVSEHANVAVETAKLSALLEGAGEVSS